MAQASAIPADFDAICSDPATRMLLRTGQTMGCFYIESPAMRALLKKMRCERYEDLVAASSIIRPGVVESGMMREYLERRNMPSRRRDSDPLADLLKETFGVMVYQEDVIRVAHTLMGLSLEKADLLRRAMSGKSRSRGEMDRLRDDFFESGRAKGFSDQDTERIWEQIRSFARYAFCKGHSASFARLSMEMTWLKAHHPAEFMAGVLSNGGGFYGAAAYVSEARRMGLAVRAPDINGSGLETAGRTERGLGETDPPAGKRSTGAGWVRVGLLAVGGMERSWAERIVSGREAGGAYASLADFVGRVGLGREVVERLIRCGALDGVGENRAVLHWELDALLGGKGRGEGSGELF